MEKKRKEKDMVNDLSLSLLFEPFRQLACEVVASLKTHFIQPGQSFFLIQKNNMSSIADTHEKKNVLKQIVVSMLSKLSRNKFL